MAGNSVLKVSSIRLVIPVLGVLTLAGCASVQETSGGGNGGGGSRVSDPIPHSVYVARGQVLRWRNQYRESAERLHTEQTAFDSTLLGIAAGAVISAFTGGSGTTVGALGLSGGAIGGYRSYYNPQGQGLAHLKAVHALSCVLDESQLLFSVQGITTARIQEQLGKDVAAAGDDRSQKTADLTADAQRKAETQVTTTLSSASSSLDQALQEFWTKTAKSTASALKTQTSGIQAQTQARATAADAAAAAKAAIDSELSAYLQAPTVIWKALNKVIAYVDMQTVRDAPDLKGFQGDLVKAAQGQAQTISAAKQARTELNNARLAHSTAVAENALAENSPGSGGTEAAEELNGKTQQALVSALPGLSYGEIDMRIAACAADL